MNVRLVVAALVATFVGCSDSNEPENLIGAVFFDYTGAPGSPFSVSGKVPLSEAQSDNSNWAMGARVDNPDGVLVVAQRVGTRDSTSLFPNDLVFIGVDRVTTGTSTINSPCQADLCAGMALIFRNNACSLRSGSVAVTDITPRRLKGTFSGSGYCVNFTTETADSTAFTASAGTFDVPLQSGGAVGFRRLTSSVRLRP